MLRAVPKRLTRNSSQDTGIDWSDLGMEEAADYGVETQTTDVFLTEAFARGNDTEQTDSLDIPVAEDAATESAGTTESPMENTPGDGSSQPAAGPSAESQGPTEAQAPPTLAEILQTPLPPPVSVDNMIAESLGNVFQKKVVKDPALRALIDGQEDLDMRELAAELKRFAIEIGASKS